MRTTPQLPSLLSLRAFEATARLLSFSLAAQELFVTQSAISHQVQKLEGDLGVALFERRARAIALTVAGQTYYARVHAAFELLRQGTQEARAPMTKLTTLTVGLLASFATRWLAPRLESFHAAHPNIVLKLLPEISLADVSGGEVDVAIRYGRGGWSDVHAQQLMPERLSAVCAPALLVGANPPSEPRDLLRFPVLTSHSRQPFEWDAWAHRFGVDLRDARTVQLHDYNIVVEATLAGQGIAMGRHNLISLQLASGALVQALPDTVLDEPRIGWWLVTPKAGMSKAASGFCTWLTKTAREGVLGRTY
ncbi:LysR substrate-binding domain-containing protein [Paraburkholderia strydomiana]|uniref:LysR substrate-binding domain-containing protein n=1 Tax=Paraburkholderia strydomiana TaxID=1245417 RepID=UPI00285FF7E9|nr:LysR substrate-binding domain-containing protein [Paraburkholderia strydomiana]MDR7006629.1 LysR family glycine cleavage system transcriptional activator [Paraburkholderia strydomiana]